MDSIMEDKVIRIDCRGSIEEIISSLKEVLEKLEDAYEVDPYYKLEEGKQIESYDRLVILTVIE